MGKKQKKNTSSKRVSPSKQPGMGALMIDGGTAFRVWAPHASAVYVTGTFNDWSRDANPLASEENGYWSGDVPGAGPGDEYKYVLINGDRELLRNDPYARALTNSAGNSLIYDPRFDWGDDAYQTPAWNEMVIYELHIGTFNAGNADKPATFQDAIERIPYLSELDINAIEVMPVMEFPGAYSWGYNPAAIFAVESDYGGPDGLKNFVKAAHAHGIAVILDVVYNHVGPNDVAVWQFDGWSENDGGGIYFYNDHRGETPWGHTRPDYGRGEVREYIRDNVMMWLHEYHIDGIRWDSTYHTRHLEVADGGEDLPDGWSLMQWINEEIAAQQPWKITIAEDLGGNEWITKPTGEGGAGFDAQWDIGFADVVRDVLLPPDDANRNIGALAEALGRTYNGDAFARVIYDESHDEVANGKARVPQEISPDDPDSLPARKRSVMGAALVFTGLGIPMIFQGQELLEDGYFSDHEPLDWSKLDGHTGNVKMYHDLIALRRNLDDNSRGLRAQNLQVYHLNDAEKVMAYQRWDQGGVRDSVVVVVNLSNARRDGYLVGFPQAGLWTVRFNSDWAGYDNEFGDTPALGVETTDEERDGLPCSGSVTIGPYTVLVLSQED